MADLNADNYKNVFVDQPKVMARATDYGPKLRLNYDHLLLAGSNQDDWVICGRLQKGVKIQPETIVYHDALGASTDLRIAVRGIASGDVTELYAEEDTSSAGTVGGGGDIDVFPLLLTEDCLLVLELTNADATGDIKAHFYYTET